MQAPGLFRDFPLKQQNLGRMAAVIDPARAVNRKELNKIIGVGSALEIVNPVFLSKKPLYLAAIFWAK